VNELTGLTTIVKIPFCFFDHGAMARKIQQKAELFSVTTQPRALTPTHQLAPRLAVAEPKQEH